MDPSYVKIIGSIAAVACAGVAQLVLKSGEGYMIAMSAAAGLLSWVWARRPGDAPPKDGQ